MDDETTQGRPANHDRHQADWDDRGRAAEHQGSCAECTRLDDLTRRAGSDRSAQADARVLRRRHTPHCPLPERVQGTVRPDEGQPADRNDALRARVAELNQASRQGRL
jgi:hypothetical protein